MYDKSVIMILKIKLKTKKSSLLQAFNILSRGGLESEFAAEIRKAPIAVCQEEANEQHYEVRDQGCQKHYLQSGLPIFSTFH